MRARNARKFARKSDPAVIAVLSLVTHRIVCGSTVLKSPEQSLTAPTACTEDRPCQSKTFVTCPCQRRKKEVRCQATKLNPWPTRESTLECDDECLRLQRNRQLAEALNIDPETHTDDHVPYSDTTLKLFRENFNSAPAIEREFRDFAASDDKRFRFRPMPRHLRAFIHALAEDFGLDSESLDPEPHRHVILFKTSRFVSAPRKTLAQCLRITKPPVSAVRPATSQKQETQPFNALLVRNPRFGLTINEFDEALAPDLAPTASRTDQPPLKFTTWFLPSDEIVVTAAPKTTAAAVATCAPTPQAVESALSNLKSAVARTVSRLGLATGGVSLCHVEGPSGSSYTVSITRREGDSRGVSGADGWSTIVSRGSWRRAAAAPETNKVTLGSEQRAPGAFVALQKLRKKEELEKRKRVEETEKVEEDWLVAVEKMDLDGEGSGQGDGGTGDEVVTGATGTDGEGEKGTKDEAVTGGQREASLEGGDGRVVAVGA